MFRAFNLCLYFFYSLTHVVFLIKVTRQHYSCIENYFVWETPGESPCAICFHFLSSNLTFIGSRDLSTMSPRKTTSSRLVMGWILKFWMTFVSITLSSSMAKRWPMQLRWGKINFENLVKIPRVDNFKILRSSGKNKIFNPWIFLFSPFLLKRPGKQNCFSSHILRVKIDQDQTFQDPGNILGLGGCHKS